MTPYYFKDVPIGSTFTCNGNECLKRSSRTATIIRFNRWFYYGQWEPVNERP